MEDDMNKINYLVIDCLFMDRIQVLPCDVTS